MPIGMRKNVLPVDSLGLLLVGTNQPLPHFYMKKTEGDPQMQSLQDRVVVITGASRGIGAAAAELFAAENARLVLAARKQTDLNKTASRLKIDKKRVLVVSADVSSAAGVKKIVTQALKKFKRIDVFVNNAGTGTARSILDTTEKDYNLMMDTNLKSVFYSYKELLPRMIRQKGGQIINISSLAGRMGLPGMAVYSASKAALNAFTEAVALEMRNHNIKINCLSPGSTDTSFGYGRTKRPSPKEPSGKIQLTPAQVAEAIVFLAKQDANAFTLSTEIRP